ncbi:hypothetical protein ACFVYC_04635 [Pseudarthrobacter sp. NPDC058329]|uniref:hypothetical protein n=1 Tax=Pseudarthrobacter sp. NPDC058329 TaxID=3346448 RepID=UPI0036DB6327
MAELVFSKSGIQSQKDLTSRLPKDDWRLARPNRGHFLAIALLLEGALRHIITLNYDLALQTALSQLGSGDKISIIHGPDDHGRSASNSLIYLHRSVDDDEEQWVLRKSVLDTSWEGAWEGVVASANLSAPLTVFAGLGSPAAVLTDSVQRLATAAESEFYLVDPYPQGNKFAEALGSNMQPPIAMYWSAFMEKLSNRLVNEHAIRLEDAARELADQIDCSPVEIDSVVARLSALDLVTLGRVRASWLLHSANYATEGDESRRMFVADLLLGIGWVQDLLGGANFSIDPSGRVTIVDRHGVELNFYVAHAQGIKS